MGIFRAFSIHARAMLDYLVSGQTPLPHPEMYLRLQLLMAVIILAVTTALLNTLHTRDTTLLRHHGFHVCRHSPESVASFVRSSGGRIANPSRLWIFIGDQPCINNTTPLPWCEQTNNNHEGSWPNCHMRLILRSQNGTTDHPLKHMQQSWTQAAGCW